MRDTFPNEDCIRSSWTQILLTLCYVVSSATVQEVTSSEAVGKCKTVKTCKHSSIPGKNCFVSCSVCKLRNSSPNRAGSRQMINLSPNAEDNKALQRHIFVFFVISRTTSQGQSENSDQSGPLHPMLPNADHIIRADIRASMPYSRPHMSTFEPNVPPSDHLWGSGGRPPMLFVT